jgi:Uma2 family endonuclease
MHSMATVAAPPDQHFVLTSVDWHTYSLLLRAFARRPGVRLTYDRGALEIMTLSPEHEHQVSLLRRLVEAFTEELSLTLKSGRSTTLRRRRHRRGLEPDECYWIQSEPLVRNRDRLDLRRDPPPDLALEIEVSRTAIDRLPVYAALRIREVWRFDGHSLTFFALDNQGRYAPVSHGLAFPQLTPMDLLRFLALRGQIEENTILRQFRAWVRQTFASGGAGTGTP